MLANGVPEGNNVKHLPRETWEQFNHSIPQPPSVGPWGGRVPTEPPCTNLI
eukprot:COSAG04_NODE_7019_length_1208_cov_3.126240_1_plen_50_part_10